MKNQKGYTAVELIIGLFFIVVGFGGLAGWVMNIVAIFNDSFAHITGMLVMRIIGVFIAPIGAILGWI